MKMYKEIVLLLLFLDYVSTQEITSTSEQAVDPRNTTDHMNMTYHPNHILTTVSQTQEPPKIGSKGRIVHKLPGPVITVIVFAAIAGIVGVILFGSFFVRWLITKNSVNMENKDSSSP